MVKTEMVMNNLATIENSIEATIKSIADHKQKKIELNMKLTDELNEHDNFNKIDSSIKANSKKRNQIKKNLFKNNDRVSVIKGDLDDQKSDIKMLKNKLSDLLFTYSILTKHRKYKDFTIGGQLKLF